MGTLNEQRRAYSGWLVVLTGLFLLRVVAQPLSLTGAALWVPPFDAWHSGLIPYRHLVTLQLLILVGLAYSAWRLRTTPVIPRRGMGVGLLAAGSLYLGVMVVRLLLGATLLSGHPWFDRPLPTIFHMVLAAYLLVFGHFHFRSAVP